MKNLTVPVVFELELDPGYKGVIPRLIGSISELGFWDTAHGVDARRIAKDSTIWKVKVHIPQRSFFYYNWVLMEKREVLQEDNYRQADIGVFGGLMKTKYDEGDGEFIVDGGCKVSVATHYQLSYNESLELVGSGDYLGNWEISGHSKCFSSNDVWCKKFEMKQGTTEEFKLVIVDRESGQIKRWQSGENRVIKIEEGLNFKMVYVPWGGRYLQEGMTIPMINICECLDYQPMVEDVSPVASPRIVSREPSKLSLTNGDLDDSPQDLELTLEKTPTWTEVIAALCTYDNDEAGKTLTTFPLTLDIKTLIGDRDCVGDVVADGENEQDGKAACKDLSLPDLIQDLNLTVAAKAGEPNMVEVLGEIKNGVNKLKAVTEPSYLSQDFGEGDAFDADMKQLPFYGVGNHTDETDYGETAALSPKEVFDEEHMSFESAVSSEAYIDEEITSLETSKQSPSPPLKESSELICTEDMEIFTEIEATTSVEVIAAAVPEANLPSSQEPNSEESWSKPRRAAFKLFNFVNEFCCRLVF